MLIMFFCIKPRKKTVYVFKKIGLEGEITACTCEHVTSVIDYGTYLKKKKKKKKIIASPQIHYPPQQKVSQKLLNTQNRVP